MDGAFPSAKGEGFTSGGSDQGYGGRGRGAGGPGGRGFRGTAENAKTKLCNRWLQGDCRFGDRCNFAHGEQELRQMAPRSPDSMGPGGPGRMPYGGRGRGGYGMPGRGPGGRFGRGGYGYGGAPGGYGYGAEGGAQGGYRENPSGTGQDAWATSGYPTTGPNGWVMYKTKETGEAYYHNHRTNVTQWDRPADWPA
mmetsp:Transcript_36068/g.91137  ORF Transcript_36068/g.91137 Transcript_36068/m.91137 type:complete len:195 (-) Transcript_36068:1452-2036(-)